MKKRGGLVFLIFVMFGIILFISGCDNIKGIDFEVIATPNGVDYNADGCVNQDDFAVFSQYYQDSDLKADFNGNGVIDFGDFLKFSQMIDNGCAPLKNEGNTADVTSVDGEVGVEKILEDEQKILVVIENDAPKLSYQPSENKILGMTIRRSPDDENKYIIYALTTPGFPGFSVSLYGPDTETRKKITPTFETSIDNLFGKKISGGLQGELYSFEFDFTELPIDSYSVMIRVFVEVEDLDKVFPGGFTHPSLSFDIISTSGYDVSGSCTTLFKHGRIEDSIDLVFVPDGYENSLGGKYTFAYDVDQAVQEMWKEPTLSKYKDKMNIYRVNAFDFNTACRCVGDNSNDFSISCCNAEEIRKAANLCGSDNNVIHVLTTVESPYISGQTRFIEKEKEYPLMQLRYNPTGTKSSGITVNSRLDPRTPIHEMGHVVATLPDYYLSYGKWKNKVFEVNLGANLCENHPCMMCTDKPFSDKGLCYDKPAMVEYLNQWCKVKKLKISDKNPRSPYPNPFNPDKGQKSKVNVNVQYEEGSEPCFGLMKVYDARGLWIDFLVSENPVEEGSFAFAWDGKDINGKYMPSGVYTYVVSVGDKKQNVKGTLIK